MQFPQFRRSEEPSDRATDIEAGMPMPAFFRLPAERAQAGNWMGLGKAPGVIILSVDGDPFLTQAANSLFRPLTASPREATPLDSRKAPYRRTRPIQCIWRRHFRRPP